jgi:RNA polymerase sigma factor (sigma-70 family)
VPFPSALVAVHGPEADAGAPSDAELVIQVRSGRTDAYAVLYGRHVASARVLARQLTRCTAEAEDLVAEAFTKLFATLLAGGGPDAAFRAYLLTTLRHAFHDRLRRDRRLELSDDMTRHDPGVPWEDQAVSGLESQLAARAFTRLPERWRTVLWHTEVEQDSPAEVASLLGLSPNGVSALAYRAREALRQAYLQEHLGDRATHLPGTDQHRATVDRLGAWARDGLSTRQRAAVESHLAACSACRGLAVELADVSGGLRREPVHGASGADLQGSARPGGSLGTRLKGQ